MRSALRALCGDDERLIMRLDEQVGFLFDGNDSKSLVAEVYGWAEAKRVELGHSYSMSNPFARFHLANRARLVSGQRLVSRNGMSFTAIKALTWGDGALTCKAVIITRH
jgi:hypothetical protein